MRASILTLLLIVVASPCALAQSFEFSAEHPFKLGNSQGKVEISLDESRLRRGERYRVNYKFTNINISYPVYNWQFTRLIPAPGQLALYDADKRYIGDLIADVGGSRVRVTLNDWTYLHGGSYVGTSLSFTAGSVPRTKYWSARNPLPPGQYYIQLIMYKLFMSERPYLTEEVLTDFRQNFDRSELCRSNAVAVKLVYK
jgi:hypothetical protein